jgi:hypothetical protein
MWSELSFTRKISDPTLLTFANPGRWCRYRVPALASVLFLAIVGFIGWGWWIDARSSDQGSVGHISYDVSRPWIGIPLLIVAGLIFLAGFYWDFRRATRANRLSG